MAGPFYRSPFGDDNPYMQRTAAKRRSQELDGGTLDEGPTYTDPDEGNWGAQAARSIAANRANEVTNLVPALVHGLRGDDEARLSAVERYERGAERGRALGPDIQSFEDAEKAGGGVGNYGAALGYMAADMAPDLVGAGIGGLLGRGLARSAARRSIVRGQAGELLQNPARQAAIHKAREEAGQRARAEAIKEAGSVESAVSARVRGAMADVDDQARAQALKDALRISGRTPRQDKLIEWSGVAGGIAGATIPSIPRQNAENAEYLAREDLSQEDAAKLAAGAGGSAALAYLPFNRLAGRFGAGAADDIARAGDGLMTRVGKEFGKQGLQEGAEEVGQQVVSLGAHAAVDDDLSKLYDEDAAKKYIASAVGGFVLGGALGGSVEVGRSGADALVSGGRTLSEGAKQAREYIRGNLQAFGDRARTKNRATREGEEVPPDFGEESKSTSSVFETARSAVSSAGSMVLNAGKTATDKFRRFLRGTDGTPHDDITDDDLDRIITNANSRPYEDTENPVPMNTPLQDRLMRRVSRDHPVWQNPDLAKSAGEAFSRVVLGEDLNPRQRGLILALTSNPKSGVTEDDVLYWAGAGRAAMVDVEKFSDTAGMDAPQLAMQMSADPSRMMAGDGPADGDVTNDVLSERASEKEIDPPQPLSTRIANLVREGRTVEERLAKAADEDEKLELGKTYERILGDFQVAREELQSELKGAVSERRRYGSNVWDENKNARTGFASIVAQPGRIELEEQGSFTYDGKSKAWDRRAEARGLEGEAAVAALGPRPEEVVEPRRLALGLDTIVASQMARIDDFPNTPKGNVAKRRVALLQAFEEIITSGLKIKPESITEGDLGSTSGGMYLGKITEQDAKILRALVQNPDREARGTIQAEIKAVIGEVKPLPIEKRKTVRAAKAKADSVAKGKAYTAEEAEAAAKAGGHDSVEAMAEALGISKKLVLDAVWQVSRDVSASINGDLDAIYKRRNRITRRKNARTDDYQGKADAALDKAVARVENSASRRTYRAVVDLIRERPALLRRAGAAYDAELARESQEPEMGDITNVSASDENDALRQAPRSEPSGTNTRPTNYAFKAANRKHKIAERIAARAAARAAAAPKNKKLAAAAKAAEEQLKAATATLKAAAKHGPASRDYVPTMDVVTDVRPTETGGAITESKKDEAEIVTDVPAYVEEELEKATRALLDIAHDKKVGPHDIAEAVLAAPDKSPVLFYAEIYADGERDRRDNDNSNPVVLALDKRMKDNFQGEDSAEEQARRQLLHNVPKEVVAALNESWEGLRTFSRLPHAATVRFSRMFTELRGVLGFDVQSLVVGMLRMDVLNDEDLAGGTSRRVPGSTQTVIGMNIAALRSPSLKMGDETIDDRAFRYLAHEVHHALDNAVEARTGDALSNDPTFAPGGVVHNEVLAAIEADVLMDEWFSYTVDAQRDIRHPREIFAQLGALRARFPEKLNEYFPHGSAILADAYRQANGFRTSGAGRVQAPTRGKTENRNAPAAAGNVGGVPRVVARRPEVSGTGEKLAAAIRAAATSAYNRKDAEKAARATAFIGDGARGSSTHAYRQMAERLGMLKDTYTSSDVVFVSANGARANRVPVTKDGALTPQYAALDAAIEAGATIITDVTADRQRGYNVGEREIAEYLSANGYVADASGGTWAPRKAKKSAPKASRPTAAADVIKQATDNDVPSDAAEKIVDAAASEEWRKRIRQQAEALGWVPPRGPTTPLSDKPLRASAPKDLKGMVEFVKYVMGKEERLILDRVLSRPENVAKLKLAWKDAPAIVRLLDDSRSGMEIRIAAAYIARQDGLFTRAGVRAEKIFATMGDNLVDIFGLSSDTAMAQRILDEVADGTIQHMKDRGRTYSVRELEARRNGSLQRAYNWLKTEGPISDALSTFWTGINARMMDTGVPAIRQIVGMLQRPQGATDDNIDRGLIPAIRTEQLKWHRKVDRIVRDLKPREREKMLTVLQRGAVAGDHVYDIRSEKVRVAVEDMRQLFRDFDAYRRESIDPAVDDDKMPRKRENYFPVVMDIVGEGRSETLAKLYAQDHFRETLFNKFKVPSKERTDETHARLVARMVKAAAEPATYDPSKPSIEANVGARPENARFSAFVYDMSVWETNDDGVRAKVSDDPRSKEQRAADIKAFERVQSKNIDEIFARYFNPMVRVVEFQRRFGTVAQEASKEKSLSYAEFAKKHFAANKKVANKSADRDTHGAVVRGFIAQADADGLRAFLVDHKAKQARLKERVDNFKAGATPDAQAALGALRAMLEAVTDEVAAAEKTLAAGGRKPKVVWNRRGKLDAMLAEAKKQGADEADIKLVENAIKAALGTYGLDTSPTLEAISPALAKKFSGPKTKAFIQGAQSYQNLRLLPLALLSSLVDPMGIAVRSGGEMGQAFGGMRAGMRTLFNKKEAERMHNELLEIGLADDFMPAIASHPMFDQHDNSFARKVNEAVFKWNGMNAWVQATRVMAVHAGHKFLLKHAEMARKYADVKTATEAGDGLAYQNSVRYLQELAVSPDDIVEVNGRVAINERTAPALQQFVDEAILRPNAMQSPLWHRDPYMGLVTQYKAFAYAIYNQITTRIGREIQHGNFRVLLAAMAYLPIVLMAEALRELIQYGVDGNPNREDWGALEHTQHAVMRTGLLGPRVDTSADIAGDLKRNEMPGTSQLGPTGGQVENTLDAFSGRRDLGKEFESAMPASAAWRHWNDANNEVEKAA